MNAYCGYITPSILIGQTQSKKIIKFLGGIIAVKNSVKHYPLIRSSLFGKK